MGFGRQGGRPDAGVDVDRRYRHLVSNALFFLAFLLACFSLATPAQAQERCSWTLLRDVGGLTPSEGSVTWPVEKDDIYLELEDSAGRVTMTGIVSSNSDVVELTEAGPGADALPLASGTTVLTAESNSPECGTYTLNVTIEVTEAPTVGDTTTSVEADSAGNPVNLDIDGYEITSVAVVDQATDGTATASGTEITYTPHTDFSGTDSFTYMATNEAGESNTATATINVEAAAASTVSWSLVPIGFSTISATTGGTPLSSGDAVPLNSVVEFRVKPRSGLTYTEAPTGCGVRYVSSDATGDLWRTAPVTADCSVAFPIALIRIGPPFNDPLPDAIQGQPYSVEFTTNRGYGPFDDWEWSGQDLPAGLSLNAETGELSGAPEESGTFEFDVTATNGVGHSNTVPHRLTVTEPVDNANLSALALSEGTLTPSFDPGTVTYTASVSHETETVTVTPTADDPASTITVNGQTVSSGSASPEIALAEGDTAIEIEVTAQDGTTTSTYTVTITRAAAPEIELTPGTLPDGTAGTDYGPVPFTAEGGSQPYSFTLGGDLPEGLGLEDGALSGTPTEDGSFTFTVTATDANDFTGERDYTLVVDAPEIVVEPDALATGKAGELYGPVPFTADGGTEPYSFTLSGDLPEGLSLEDGALSGTPTEDGSFTFTVTATDANDFTGEREYTLVVDAPEIILTIPGLPDGKVNTDYDPVTVSASGGTEPYVFDLASGDLPDGMTLAEDGRVSGIPAEGGDFAITVRARDAYGFEGTADATLRIEELNLPVAQDLVLEVMAGTSGSIDLTQGATGGPFAGAAISAHPQSEAGNARIARDGDAHMLHFAAAGGFAGTASLTYTLSNAEGTSEPATVTLTVIARPDPALDPEVIGLIEAQTETARRFANTQITNFNQRLEQLHNEGAPRSNAMGVNVSVQQGQTGTLNAYAPHESEQSDPALEAIGQAAPSANGGASEPQPAPVENLFGDLAFWSGGYVNFGTNDDGAINLDHTLVGVSGGIDYRFTPELTAGFGVGYGRDVTDIGSNGTESRAEAFSLAAYGSYRPVPGFFIDGLAGYSAMSFESLRFVTATGEFASGHRSGDQLFASLSAGYEYRNDGLLISPYGRLSGSHSTLDTFTESGGGLWNLTYGEQSIETLSGTLGLCFEYAIPMDWGVLTPRGRLEYTHDFEGSSRASLGYADLGTLPYALDVEGFSSDHISLGLGLDAQIGESWTLGFDYRTAFGANGDSQDHTFGARLGVRF